MTKIGARRTPEHWLADIVLWGERLAGHLAGVERDAFLADPLRQDAVAKCVEAIGQAAKGLMEARPGIETEHPELFLRQAYGSRVRTVHGYFSIDYSTLWTTATERIPGTVAAASRLLAATRKRLNP